MGRWAIVIAIGLAAGCSEDTNNNGNDNPADRPNNAGADGGNVIDDDAGDPEQDAGDAGDPEDVGPEVTFEDSCLFEVLGCFGQPESPLSCTWNTFSNEAGLAFSDRRAMLYTVAEDGAFIVDAFAEDNVCYSAQGDEPGLSPTGWRITLPGFEVTPFRLTFAAGQANITCSDGTQESYPEAQVRPFVPELFGQDDPACVGIDDPECSVDVDCAAQATECCRTANSGRCMDLSLCPAVPTGLTGCLKDTMDCFGAGRSPESCQISQSTGEVRLTYSAGRFATFRLGDNREVTGSAGNGLGECFSLEAEGSQPWARVDITSASSDKVFPVLFQGGRAFVTCDDDLTEQFPEDFVNRNLPVLLGEDDDLCELVD